MKVGILGAGQLGRMLALAGYPLGLSFSFFDPEPSSPARRLGEFTNASFGDLSALKKFASQVDLVTTEFENIDIDTLTAVAESVPFFPGVAPVAISQDRLSEKEFFHSLGIATAPFQKVDTSADLERAIATIGLPIVLKTRRLGYDGKGQVVIKRPGDAEAARQQLGGKDLIAEGFVQFNRELSIIAVRSVHGETAFYRLNINAHADGILRQTVVSEALVGSDLQVRAEKLGREVLSALNYVGVLVIELFDTEQGLIVNEMAPRVHNSGHWSIEGAKSSQFQNHLRAICGLPLGTTDTYGHCGMINILHTRPDFTAILNIPGANLHWYGKEPRPGRKLGHLTFVEPSLAALRERLDEATPLLNS